jgi:hypothetical protein
MQPVRYWVLLGTFIAALPRNTNRLSGGFNASRFVFQRPGLRLQLIGECAQQRRCVVVGHGSRQRPHAFGSRPQSGGCHCGSAAAFGNVRSHGWNSSTNGASIPVTEYCVNTRVRGGNRLCENADIVKYTDGMQQDCGAHRRRCVAPPGDAVCARRRLPSGGNVAGAAASRSPR